MLAGVHLLLCDKRKTVTCRMCCTFLGGDKPRCKVETTEWTRDRELWNNKKKLRDSSTAVRRPASPPLAGYCHFLKGEVHCLFCREVHRSLSVPTQRVLTSDWCHRYQSYLFRRRGGAEVEWTLCSERRGICELKSKNK